MQTFEDVSIPYDDLERFGLGKEMLEDLPQRAIDDILSGRPSPVFMFRHSDDGGVNVEWRCRFQLSRHSDGSTGIIYFPFHDTDPLSVFDDVRQKKLRDGRIVVGDVVNKSGQSVKSYIQYDEPGNQVLTLPTFVISANIGTLSQDLNLTPAERSKIENGDPLTTVIGQSPVTVGIDLAEPTGIRYGNGDCREWLRARKDDEWERYNFGLNGCWVMNPDGLMNYVEEDKYTDDIVQAELALSHRQGLHM